MKCLQAATPRLWFLCLRLFSWQEAAPRGRVTAPPLGARSRHSRRAAAGAAQPEQSGQAAPVPSRDQAGSRRLGGGDGGRAGSCRGTPAAAPGGWGHGSGVDDCGRVLPARPYGLLEAMAGVEAGPRCQPLLSSAGKCSTFGAGRRR